MKVGEESLTRTPLSRLCSIEQPYGTLQRDKSHRGGPLCIGDRKFERGLGTHADSEIVFDLGKKYEWLEVWIGIDVTAKRRGHVRFTITDWDPPHAFESDEVAFDIPVHFTMEVLPSDTGSTLRVMYDEPKVENPAELESLFRDAAKVALQTLAKRLDDDAQP